MAIGAVVSAAADVAIQVGVGMYEGRSFGQAVRNINRKQVLGSVVAGAIGVGVVSKVSQAAKIYKLGKNSTALAKTFASPIGDAVGSVAGQVISDGQVSLEKVENDVIGGTVGSALGNARIDALKKTPGYKAALRRLDHTERIASGSTRSSRLQAAENAQKIVDNYGASSTQALSSGASKGVSEAVKVTRSSTDGEQ